MESSPAAAAGAHVVSHAGPMGTSGQQNAAAAFFARTRNKHVSLTGSPVRQAQLMQARTMACPQGAQPGPEQGTASNEDPANEERIFDFAAIMRKCPPPVPSTLLKRMETTSSSNGDSSSLHSGLYSHSMQAKVRVLLRVANSGLIDEKRGSFFKMDKKKRQVTLCDPSSNCASSLTVSAPKMFAFDGLFTDEDPQSEITSAALTEPLASVVAGTDACLFCFGHAHLGKTYTMVGSDEASKELGVIPTAIAWLFRSIKEKKEKSGTRFSVRVTAIEIGGAREELNDLLSDYSCGLEDDSSPAPSALFPQYQSGSVFQHACELRCPTPEKAAFYLDSALGSRSVELASGRDSHFVYTLHVYQSTAVAEGRPGAIGGRSRLHLVDFGGCERMKTSSGGITLSGLGHVILGILNGQRHLPFKESPVTQMLKECLGSLSCQVTMLAHVSPAPAHYSETLHTTQLSSRIHRMRRKKAKSSGSSGGGSAGSGSSDEMKRLVQLSSSDVTSTDPSSSEQSCDTVIYVGHGHGDDDDEGTDAEHPPVYIPHLNSGDNRAVMAKVLRGSTAELKQKASSGSERASSRTSTLERRKARTSKSPLQQQPLLSPKRHRPGSVGSTPTRMARLAPQPAPGSVAFPTGSLPRPQPKGKMPLHGKVAGYRQPSTGALQEHWIDQPRVLHQQSWEARQLIRTHHQDWPANQQQHQQQQQQQQRVYGYMDEHKKNMIQQWVECQALQKQNQKQQSPKKMPTVAAPAATNRSGLSSSEAEAEPEPFAWLKSSSGPGAANSDGECRVLTQFKQADSSEESSDTSGQQQSSQPPTKSSSIQLTLSPADIHQEDDPDALCDEERMIITNRTVPDQPVQQTHDGLKEDDDSKSSSNEAEKKLSTTEDTAAEPLSGSPSKRPMSLLEKEQSQLHTLDELCNDCEQLVQDLKAREEGHHHQQQSVAEETAPAADVPEVESDESSVEPPKLSYLDSQKLHFVNNGHHATHQLTEAVSTSNLHEHRGTSNDFFLHNFDQQVAKLHELYASVSSISAKSQSHIEERHQLRRRNNEATSSTFSLGALALNGAEKSSNEQHASIGSDLNSLCSEPVLKLDEAPAPADLMAFMQGWNGAEGGQGGNGLASLSLSDLGFTTAEAAASKKSNGNGRSDSPVLQGMDQELAKYAKLKDLEQAYVAAQEQDLPPPPAAAELLLLEAEQQQQQGQSAVPASQPKTEPEEQQGLSSSSRPLPEGASTPDWKKADDDLSSPGVHFEVKQHAPVLPQTPQKKVSTAAKALGVVPVPPPTIPVPSSRRSPGTGQSSCGSDHEETDKLKKSKRSSANNNQAVTCSPLRTQQQQSVGQSNGHNNHVEAVEETKKRRVPRFSRLFSTASKKISKSPLKINTNSRRQKENSAADSKAAKSSSGSGRRNKGTSTAPQPDKKSASSVAATPSCFSGSKNVPGTSFSSTQSRVKPVLPSPYSFPSKPRTGRRGGAETSSNDSGISPKEDKSHHHSQVHGGLVRMRSSVEGGRGANQTQCRNQHCKSSGYESFGLEESEERDSSLESPTTATASNVAQPCVTLSKALDLLQPLPILHYGADYIKKLDSRWRSDRIRQLKHTQAGLKADLHAAKSRLCADPGRWSYELHVESCWPPEQQPHEPAFVEAFQKETHILRKRVDACKSHVKMITAFDVKARPPPGCEDDSLETPGPSSSSPLDSCCTTDCDYAHTIALEAGHTTETDII